MRQRSDPEISAWFSKVDRDLRMAELAIGIEDPMPDQACFHAQQCVEKALKALLVAADRPVPRTHDLLALLHDLLVIFPELDRDAGILARLTPYGVSPRYPSWLAEETLEEAAEAVREAGRPLVGLEGVLAS